MKSLKEIIKKAKEELGIKVPQYERSMETIVFIIYGINGYGTSALVSFYMSNEDKKDTMGKLISNIASKIGGQVGTMHSDDCPRIVFPSITIAEDYEEMQEPIRSHLEGLAEIKRADEQRYKTMYTEEILSVLEKIANYALGNPQSLARMYDLTLIKGRSGMLFYSFVSEELEVKWERKQDDDYDREYLYWKGLDDYIYRIRIGSNVKRAEKCIEVKYW